MTSTDHPAAEAAPPAAAPRAVPGAVAGPASSPPEQLTLPGVDAAPRSRGARPGPVAIADELPVARIALDLAPAHLDRVFDYLVPATSSDDAQPGVRVKVRFAGQDVDGYLLERAASSDHDGRLAPLRRVVSPERVLAPEVARLARAVADHYAGTLSDVLRLAVPPRHARAEAPPASPRPAPAAPMAPTGEQPAGPSGSPSQWAPYRGGGAFLGHLARGHAPRAVWTALPGLATPAPDVTVTHAAAAIAEAVRVTVTAGRGALVVVPDARDVDQVLAALAAAGLATWSARTGGDVARLTADDGPAARYRNFLAALRGDVHVVVGTRAAVYAPVRDLGLVVCWNDGEDTLAEPRAPYPHARQVLALRSDQQAAAYLLGSWGRTVQAQALLDSGWARELAAPRGVLRARAPRVRALTSVELASEGPAATARIPGAAWRAARAALADGPVLVQVPRAGYVPAVACARCRTAARCGACHGPLALPGRDGPPQCGWCGKLAGGWSCTECHGTTLRAVRVGSGRTAEELGRAFPGVNVRVSGASAPGGVLAAVPATPALVVATPGAEPVAAGGYTAALLLDAAVSTAGVGLTVAQDALHRWLAAAALVRPGPTGQVLLVGDGAPAPTNALVRWDPAGLADRDLAERRDLDLPPAVRVAAITGDRGAVDAVVSRIALATPQTVLGPVEVPAPRGTATLQPPVRAIVRVPTREGRRLARQLAASLAVRSARREGGTLRAQLDPKDLL